VGTGTWKDNSIYVVPALNGREEEGKLCTQQGDAEEDVRHIRIANKQKHVRYLKPVRRVDAATALRPIGLSRARSKSSYSGAYSCVFDVEEDGLVLVR